MAIGLVTFDQENPRCAAPPSAEEQYLFEWTFANLDANGDRYLDQTEISILVKAVPEVEPFIQKGAYSVEFLNFVDLMRHREAQDVDGMAKLREFLKQPFFYYSTTPTTEGGDLSSDTSQKPAKEYLALTEFMNSFTANDLDNRIANENETSEVAVEENSLE